MDNNVSHPVEFFSKRLSNTQRSYSAFDRELLTVYLSVLHLKHIIEGQQLHIFSDHKPLVAEFYSQNCPKSDRQQRHPSLISEFCTSISHISGGENIVADAFSRSINAIEVDFPDLAGLADLQHTDDEIDELKSQLKTHQLPNGKQLWCDMDNIFPRPYVPKQARKLIFDHLHNLSCLLYTSPSPRDATLSRMPSSA